MYSKLEMSKIVCSSYLMFHSGCKDRRVLVELFDQRLVLVVRVSDLTLQGCDQVIALSKQVVAGL